MSSEMNSMNFPTEVLHSEIPVLLDFYATWCVPCRMLAAELDKLAEKYSNVIRVYRVNVEDEPVLTARYSVLEIPTVIFFKNGRSTDRFIGYRTAEELENMILKI